MSPERPRSAAMFIFQQLRFHDASVDIVQISPSGRDTRQLVYSKFDTKKDMDNGQGLFFFNKAKGRVWECLLKCK